MTALRPEPRIAAVVAAAGQGSRLGRDIPKALHPLGGEPMVVRAVRTLAAARIDLVVVAAPPGRRDEVYAGLAGTIGAAELLVVEGGSTRVDSVRAALGVLPESVDIVLVHDAARPLAPESLVDDVVAAVEGGADAVVPGLLVTDTVKQVSGTGEVVATVDRSALRAVQTPQGFRRTVLDAAYRSVDGADVTDDAGLVERTGGRVLVVPGHDEAFKVTTPLDLMLAESVLARREGGHG